jgi:BirA family biotin operon repressor/biotin-[acetyl-CoA-carboxylase] ligase
MDFEIIHLQEVVSTNSWLLERGTTSSCNPSSITHHPSPITRPPSSITHHPSPITRHPSPITQVVIADYQTGGRGCGTNMWESERGKNLLFSVLLHPVELPANQQFRISMAVSVALREMLSQYADGFSIKWPNDIYWNDRKICGILIENRLTGTLIRDSVIGIGLNVNQRVFHSDAPNPVSLSQIVGHDIDCDALLNDFLGRLDSVSIRETLCFDYQNNLFRREKHAEYADRSGRFTAELQRVMPDGRLVLIDAEGRERIYAFKEVQFIL